MNALALKRIAHENAASVPPHRWNSPTATHTLHLGRHALGASWTPGGAGVMGMPW